VPTPSSDAATVPLVGGRPCIDLVNTVSWRGDPSRRVDYLQTPADVVTWCRRAGVLDETEADLLSAHLRAGPARGRRLLADVRDLREAITAHLVEAHVGAQSPDLDALGPRIVEALRRARLAPGEHGARWVTEALDEHTPVVRLTLDLHEQLTEPVGALGTCADPACGWAYLDTSRSQNRRWCRSSDCGNRDRVRRHSSRARRSTG
jgi:predicted RNA-binding Zn ribbon-like protein